MAMEETAKEMMSLPHAFGEPMPCCRMWPARHSTKPVQGGSGSSHASSKASSKVCVKDDVSFPFKEDGHEETDDEEEDDLCPSAPRVYCKVCVAKGEDSPPHAGCRLCVAKACALARIEATGGNVMEAAAKEGEPAGVVTAANLELMVAEGALIVKAAAKEEGQARPVVTVRMPDTYVERYKTHPLPTPIRRIPEDFFLKNPDLREMFRAGAVTILATIEKEENIRSQIVKYGCVTLDLEVE